MSVYIYDRHNKKAVSQHKGKKLLCKLYTTNQWKAQSPLKKQNLSAYMFDSLRVCHNITISVKDTLWIFNKITVLLIMSNSTEFKRRPYILTQETMNYLQIANFTPIKKNTIQ